MYSMQWIMYASLLLIGIFFGTTGFVRGQSLLFMVSIPMVWVLLSAMLSMLFSRWQRISQLVLLLWHSCVGYVLWNYPQIITHQKKVDYSWLEVSIGMVGGLVVWMCYVYALGKNWRILHSVRFLFLLLTSVVLVVLGQRYAPDLYTTLDLTERYTTIVQYLSLCMVSVSVVLTVLFYSFFHDTEKKSPELPILRVLFSRFNPISSVFDALEEFFGIDIQGTWAIRFVRNSIEGIVVYIVLFAWLSTSVVLIQPREQGLVEHVGVVSAVPLQSGIHLVYPYPFSKVTRVPSVFVQQIQIGHKKNTVNISDIVDGEEEKQESLLWANQHSSEEFLLLLGDGRDVISADAFVEYRIKDAYKYIYNTQNPVDILESLAYQLLMHETASRTLEEALSENIISLSKKVSGELQALVDKYELGLEIVQFRFTALHPPVAVAEEYQQVVSAQIEQETKVLQAKSYREQSIPKAQLASYTAVQDATRSARVLHATAVGEASAFTALYHSVHQDISLYKLQKRLENLEKNLQGKTMVVVDHRIEAQGAALWIQE